MSNPTTIDRRDVAHPTNPIGGHDHVEENDFGQPLDPKAAKMPAAGDSAATRGIPAGAIDRDSYSEGNDGIPPARTGKASLQQPPAEIRGDTSNSGGSSRIDPETRIPQPVKQDPAFRRNADDGNR